MTCTQADVDTSILGAALRSIGVLVGTPHSEETPARLHRYLIYWSHWTTDPPFNVTTFRNEHPRVDQLITIPGISFWSCCSHHLLPFHGKATVGYLPNERIIGLSKVTQVVRWMAKKPQVQEHLAHEIADFLEERLDPLGLAVYIRAWHTCQMLSVGPDAPQMVTTVLRGRLKKHPAKDEFLMEVQR